MNTAKHFLLAGIITLSCFINCNKQASRQSDITPVRLTCENLTNPSVIDASLPRLSWVNEVVSDKVRGACQTAYRICVASTKAGLLKGEADIWDSGKTSSGDSYLIPYAGSKLQSGKDYWWRVKVWDANDAVSEWSAPAIWGMGLLSSDEWQAQWIGAPWQGEEPRKIIRPAQSQISPQYPAPLFRKSFPVKDNVVSAKAFVTGLGYFEFYMNGKKVDDDYLTPNFTNYTTREDLKYTYIAIDNNFRGYRVMYLAYDITDLLQKRQNVAGAIVGDGYYDSTSKWMTPFGSARFLCQIEITYKDGTKDIVCSDSSWKVKESPIIRNGIFDGEIYDANLEIDDWETAGYDDSDWKTAVLREAPVGELTAHAAPTDKVVAILKPVSLTKKENGDYEADFGVEISGWIRFKDIRGNKGDTLSVHYIYETPETPGVQKYVFKGNGNESYAPRFTWYAFSKAVISGVSELTAEQLTAEMVNTDISVSAEFKSSNPLFEQINTIWQRCVLDNMHCGVLGLDAHRERCPYTGDGQVTSVAIMHNFDVAAFYEKWIRDMRDAQNIETGYVPNGAPWESGCGGGVPWGAAMNIIPWEHYVHYGDKKILEDNYFAMKEQVRYMLTWLTKDGTMFSQKTNLNADKPNYWLNLGDWASPYGLPDDELVHTFYLWRCADFTARAAKALNRQDDVTCFSAIANDVKKAFHKKFYDTTNKTYGDYGSNIYALVMGVPEEHYKDVVKTWRQEIVEKNKGHLNTGIFGAQFFFETLAAHGMNDVAYEAMNKRDFPSFGKWIEEGATVLWEQWSGKDSRNHPMFGGGLTWFYRTLAGVNADENEPGYRHIIIKPQLPGQLDAVFYSKITPYGKVVSEVKKTGNDRLEMNVTVPVGSYATVYIPVSDNSIVTENGQPVETVTGIDKLGIKDGYLIVKALQGSYQFEVKNLHKLKINR